MATPVPQTVTATLFERINALSKLHPLNEVELVRIRRETDKLVGVDRYHGIQVLASVECLARNEEKCYALFDEVLAANDTPEVHLNYAAAKSQFHRYTDAYKQSRQAFAQSPDDLDALGNTIEYAAKSFHYSDAAKLLEEWNKRSPDRPYKLEEGINKTIEILEAYGVDEAEIRIVVDASGDFLREQCPRNDISIGYGAIIENDADHLMVRDIFLDNAGQQEAVRVNSEMVKYLVENVDDLMAEFFLVSIVGGQ
jgi:hypothetical protein